MGRIIILEGPDGGGKTTLAKKLEAEHDFLYVHLGPPKPGEDLLNTYASLLYQAHCAEHSTVFDRLHIGESVYGPTVRGVDLLGTEGQTILERMIEGYGAEVVVVLPNVMVAGDNWSKKALAGDYIQRPDIYLKIYGKYESYAENLPVYDYTKPDSWKLSEYTLPVSPENVIGSRAPLFLFVGERANHPTLDAAFVSLSGSSHYLYEAIVEAGFQEHQMAFMNALRIDGTTYNIDKAWAELGEPLIVALGGVAKNEIRHIFGHEIYSSIFELPHPAYWSRFHAQRRPQYINMLKEVYKHV